MLETAKRLPLLPNSPAITRPPALLVCVVDGALNGQKSQEKGKVICLEGKKVTFFSRCCWSSRGEAGGCSVTLGVAFPVGLLWGRGAHGPESQVGLIPNPS